MIRRLISALVALAIVVPALAAQTVPTPRAHFGFDIGDHRKLADWGELTAYYEKLAQASPRVQVVKPEKPCWAFGQRKAPSLGLNTHSCAVRPHVSKRSRPSP